MSIWSWIAAMFRRRETEKDLPRDQHLNERYTRDAFAAAAAHATEAGMTQGSPPSA